MDDLSEKTAELGLDRQIIKEVPFQRLMTVELVDRWADGIPKPDETLVPEWTPIIVPRVTIITAGNEGQAITERFVTHGLPPPKLVLGIDTNQSIGLSTLAKKWFCR